MFRAYLDDVFLVIAIMIVIMLEITKIARLIMKNKNIGIRDNPNPDP